MPFTLSHPLFSVPLRRIVPSLSVTGLVLGSMAPDMEYFVALQSNKTIGHSLPGFLLLGIPLCLSLGYAFHRVMKPALPALLPSTGGLDQFAKDMIRPWPIRSTAQQMWYLLSLFIGYLTHIFMDNWTHVDGIFVEMLPYLRQHKVNGEPLYQLMQLFFSGLGLAVPLLLLFMKWVRWREGAGRDRRPLSSRRTKRLIWLHALSIGACLFTVKVMSAEDPLWFGIWIVAPFSCLLFGVYAASLLRIRSQYGRTSKAWLSIGALLLVMGLYKLTDYLGLRIILEDELWLLHIWLLTLTITLVTRYSWPAKQGRGLSTGNQPASLKRRL
ncbi:DUF4184 family protein [Paenibacillus sp. GCM10023252]|uniref:DUF4184 family protein n=1 Tax=Paenibacillus sp. GCM10023252 TaxID=3252649 RepID=UPI00361A1933